MVFCKQRFPQLLIFVFAKVTFPCLSIRFSSSLPFSGDGDVGEWENEEIFYWKYNAEKVLNSRFFFKKKRKKPRKQWKKMVFFTAVLLSWKILCSKKEKKGGGRKKKCCCKVLTMNFETTFSHCCFLESPPLLFPFWSRENRLSYKLHM